MKRAEHQPTSEITLYAGLFCKTWTVADVGTLLPQHSHEFPHLSLIVAGSVRVWQDGVDLGVFHAPAAVKIPARTFHTFRTLTDGVVIACLHNVDHLEADEPAIHATNDLELED